METMMRTIPAERYSFYSHDWLTTVLLRLLGTLALYACFGLLADSVFASSETGPMDSTSGSVWLLPDNGENTNALLFETDVDFVVSGLISRATVIQRFRNTGSQWAEGIYVFPLPENAAVDHFKLRIGERVIEGRIKERTQARKIYQTAKKQGVQAGLVEQQRANVFTTALANIAPGEVIIIEFEYQQTLEYKDGSYRLRFPMVIGPRFHAASPTVSDIDRHTDVSTEIADNRVNPVHIHISLDAGVPLAKLISSYHAIDISQTDTYRYSIALDSSKVFADRDFELVWTPELDQQPRSAVFTEQHDGHEYALLSLLPPGLQALGQQQLPRDVILFSMFPAQWQAPRLNRPRRPWYRHWADFSRKTGLTLSGLTTVLNSFTLARSRPAATLFSTPA